MGQVRNILFIMADQLRADYLSCEGHPTLHTPNVDGLASRGVRFDHAYVQAPLCGPSRMSFYTGRYVASHRSIWNFVPLPVGEQTIGDYLRPTGMRVALAGKTHMAGDTDGLRRLGIDDGHTVWTSVSECGFEPFDRDDGIYPKGLFPRLDTKYAHFLRANGYEADNPWEDYANAAEGPDGTILSGWEMRHSRLPARVKEEHSETAYMTDRAIEFIRTQGDAPWFLHLSFIKPHWPYIAPAPYNDMYQEAEVVPPLRDTRERESPNPVYAAFMLHEESINFSRDEVRHTVIPTYMGLVKQIDDHLGRLLDVLKEAGRIGDTMIVFTSDHGDYLGDHWLGEKELFHEMSVRVPLIIVDPDAAADVTRGTVETRLVEAIDLLPTFLEAVRVEPPSHVVEGRSLLPLVHGEMPPEWRDAVFSELDYSFRRRTRTALGQPVNGCRGFMVRTERWKYWRFENFPPQLFDLESDPREFVDLGAQPGMAGVRAELDERLFGWLRGLNYRVTAPDDRVTSWTEKSEAGGLKLGIW